MNRHSTDLSFIPSFQSFKTALEWRRKSAQRIAQGLNSPTLISLLFCGLAEAMPLLQNGGSIEFFNKLLESGPAAGEKLDDQHDQGQ